jgi:uncharacterized protein YndB with AHSA1/START domain
MTQTLTKNPATVPKIAVPIQAKILIKAAIEKVYETLTTSQGWDAWFTTGMTLDLAKEDFEFVWKNWGPDEVSPSARAKVKSFSDNQHFSFYWNYGLENGPTLVQISLKDTTKGVLVEVLETEYPDDAAGLAQLVDCATGWGDALIRLKFYLENNISAK